MSRVHMLLVTSNGAGMGHLTRQAAVALCAAPQADTTLFSLSVALPVTATLGLSGEYCPSSERQWMPQGHWHGYVRDRLVALARELEIDVIAFDGVAPYPGIGLARMRMSDVAFVWFRRGMWRPGVNTAQLKKAAFFDHIYEPGDLAAAADRGATAERGDALLLPPITMLDAIDPLPRREAAAALGIDPDRRTALVTLGSGRLGDVAAPGEVVLDELLSATDWQICVTKPAVALQHVPIRDRQRIIELRNVYPLVRYFAAFDAAVSAAGYNAVHEFVPAAIPTLYVPNPATTTDDQVARAGQLAAEGLAITAHPQAAAKLTVGVRRLADESVRRDLAAACRAVPRERQRGGAEAAAVRLTELGRTFEPGRRSVAQLAARTQLWARETVKGMLGPQRSDAVRKMLGRPPIHGPDTKLRVVIEGAQGTTGKTGDTTPLLIGTDVASERIMHGGPVEDVLAATSAHYHRQRRRIAAEYYEILGD